MNAIVLKNLRKMYNGKNGIKNVNMNVERGTVHALLGNNGAGKTTTMKCIAGIIFKDSGSIEIMGNELLHNDPSLKSLIGFSFGLQSFPRNLTGRECLKIYGEIRGIDKKYLNPHVEELLNMTGLANVSDKKVSHYSRGMLQKLDIAFALLGDPELLILDEPTAGLDPSSVGQFRELIKMLSSKGKTVVISDHQLSEVERICSGATIIKDGETAFQSSMKDLLNEDIRWIKYAIKFSSLNEDLIREIENTDGVLKFEIPGYEPNAIIIHATADSDFVDKIHKIAMKNSISIISIEVLKKTLEDVFISIVDKEGKI